MLKKFGEGLVFGAGFAISFVLIYCVVSYLTFPMIFTSTVEREMRSSRPEVGTNKHPPESSITGNVQEPSVPFYDMQIEDQIKQSSVIALAKFEPSADGKTRTIIKEFLKKEPNVKIYYDIGDEYPEASGYPSDEKVYGDGIVIFFVGSPASSRMGMSYSGNRIRGLADMPIELLRKKCEAPDA
ncbi:hypothetical protein AGMMS50256_13010 [Betaproteobacteria bacterium]|nr:hypothetical protein AGMMS50256_13010 [Betaproteobacteria bacterium]